MKSSKLKKSLLISSILFGMILLSFQCTSKKKSVKPVISDPTTVVDTITNPNNSSPNRSENEAMVDSIKKAQKKLKKKTKNKTHKKNQ